MTGSDTTVGRRLMLVAGTPVERATAAETLARVRPRGAGGPPLAVGSVNLDHVHHFRSGPAPDPSVRWLWLADGAPIARRGARLSGTRWPRVTGADLLPAALTLCADRGWRIGVLGGTAAMHERFAAAVTREHPRLVVAGYWAPERAEIESPDACAALAGAVRDARVDVLVVGLGKPRQEAWIDTWGARTGAGTLLAFGAAADFVAGGVRRAPGAVQRLGLEWLYRLALEPRRLARRYLVQGPPALARLRHARLITSPSTSEQGDRP